MKKSKIIKPAWRELVFFNANVNELNFVAKKDSGFLLTQTLDLAEAAGVESLIFISHPEATSFKKKLRLLAAHYPLRIVTYPWQTAYDVWGNLESISGELGYTWVLSIWPNWQFAYQFAQLSAFAAPVVLAAAATYNPKWWFTGNWLTLEKTYVKKVTWLPERGLYPVLPIAKYSLDFNKFSLKRLVAGEKLATVLTDFAKDNLLKAVIFEKSSQQILFTQKNYYQTSLAQIQLAWKNLSSN